MKCPNCNHQLDSYDIVQLSGKINAFKCPSCKERLYTPSWVEKIEHFLLHITMILSLFTILGFHYLTQSLWISFTLAVIAAYAVYSLIIFSLSRIAKAKILSEGERSYSKSYAFFKTVILLVVLIFVFIDIARKYL